MGVRLAVCIAFLLNGAAFAQSIFTVAGGGTDDGRPATVTSLNEPSAVAVDSSGNLYVADTNNHRVRKVAAATGIVTTVAGTGAPGFSGDGGPAAGASLDSPGGIAIDPMGNLYVADENNDRIRKISAESGIITTVAGGGNSYGDGGPATATFLISVTGVAVDASGNIYIALEFDFRVRKVSAATGIISTIAGNGREGFSGDGGPATAASLMSAQAVAVDNAGNIYIADRENARIRKVTAATGIISTLAGNGTQGFSGDGGRATAASLERPEGVAVDRLGNVYIADDFNDRIRKVTAATGIITTLVGTSESGFSGDGGPASMATLRSPSAVALDSEENLYIADRLNHRIRKVFSANGTITTVAGSGAPGLIRDGGPATAALLDFPLSVALDAAGNLYIADTSNHRIRRVAATNGHITTVAGNGVADFSGDGGPATAASLWQPAAVAVDSSANIYIADRRSGRIRKVSSATGLITTVAGNGTEGFSGDGGPALSASMSRAQGIAVDRSGNLYIADMDNHRIRKVTAATGIITTIAGRGSGFSGDGGPSTAASLYYPEDVAVDALGNLYIADSGNYRIRKIVAVTGIITTVAGNGNSGGLGDGGAATAASVPAPSSVAVDLSGNLYITSSYRVRKVRASTGVITTFAGGPDAYEGGARGDGGPATAAALVASLGLALDGAGNLYIAETDADRIRVVFTCVNVDSPRLTSPASNSSGLSTFPRLAWNSVPGAFRYDVFLDTVSPPRQIAASDISTATYAPSNLQPLTTYYWSVIAKGDPFCVPFSQKTSEVRSFTTAAACTVPGAVDAH